TLELPVADLRIAADNEAEIRRALGQALEFGKGVVHVIAGLDRLAEAAAKSRSARVEMDLPQRAFSTKRACPSCGRSFAELAALPVGGLEAMFRGLELSGREAEIARDIVAELRSRLSFLAQVGLSYLSLDRSAPTLSGGEAQRIRLASQLGSNLRGVCYILDEPTIGLHPRDNRILLDTLEKLQAKGNTPVVVEHDEDTIRRASHVIDLGPGAGKQGGRVIAEGSAGDLMRNADSLTGKFLKRPLMHPLHPPRPVTRGTPSIEIAGASLHNLENIALR